MAQIKLKSKVINTYDYGNIDISGYAIPLKPDMAEYERCLQNFLKTFATKEEVSEIAPQDMVTLSCSSENPKFNKQHITVRTGLGLYSKEFENKIIGMSVGETKTVDVAADRVTVSVEKIVREIIPELTDELAAQCGISYVHGAEDIRRYCRYKQYDNVLEEASDDACTHFAREIMQKSEFDLDESELAETKRVVSEMMSAAVSRSDTDEIRQQILDSFNQMGENMLQTAVLGQGIKELTDEDYEEYLNKRACAAQRPIEDIRRENSVVNYLVETYNELFTDTIEEYVLWKLKEFGEAMTGETV